MLRLCAASESAVVRVVSRSTTISTGRVCRPSTPRPRAVKEQCGSPWIRQGCRRHDRVATMTTTTTTRPLSSSSASANTESADDEILLETSTSSTKTTTTTTNSKSNTDDNDGLWNILLSAHERSLLQDQRALVQRARELALQVGAVSVQDYLGSPFLNSIVDETTFSIVVAGEFNAGKSTLINALLGRKVLQAGALPTTDCITIVTGATDPIEEKATETQPVRIDLNNNNINNNTTSNSTTSIHSNVEIHRIPGVELLQDLTLIDTPGTNAVVADHTARTLRLLPTADLILFVTSADRPFPESERLLLKSIEQYRKSIVVVINKMDILETAGGSHGAAEKQRVVEFVTEHASQLLGGRPVVLPVSSRDALSVKLVNHNHNHNNHNSSTASHGVWERSNFDTLERFLHESLTVETKLKTKLTNPIGQAQGMVTKSLEAVQQARQELQLDVATLQLLQSQVQAWNKEFHSIMTDFQQQVGSVLEAEALRCQVLVQRLGVWQCYSLALTHPEGLEAAWDQTARPGVSSSKKNDPHASRLKRELLEQVEETADSMATRGRAQGQALIEFLGKRPAMKHQSLVGSVSAASRFEDTRKTLVEKLSQAVDHHVIGNTAAIQEEDERRYVVQSLRRIAMVSAGLQLGAVSAGVATAAQMVDMVMGGGAATVLALTGGAVFAQGRNNLQHRHRAEWNDKRQRLDEALQTICAKEVSRVERRILDGVAPYTRFVETEQERLDRLGQESEDILSVAQRLRNRINKL